MEITFGGDGKLLATVYVVGASRADGTTACDDSSHSGALAQSIFAGRFNQFQASAKQQGGMATNDLIQAKLTINNPNTGSFSIGGGGVRSDRPEGIAGISGSITALFKNTGLLVKVKAKANTESSLQIDLAGGDDTLSFKITELKYKSEDPSISGPAGIQIGK